MKTPNITIEYGPVGSDCTGPYYITLKKEMTVGEFIAEWLEYKPNEWGYIRVKDPTIECWTDTRCRLLYRYGTLKDFSPTEGVMNSPIIDITGSGGWSRSDFTLTIERLPLRYKKGGN